MGETEVTNRQYRCFDPRHDSRLETGDFLQFSIEERGYPVNLDDQPVVRVSWERAAAFCERLASELGLEVRLPTAEEWEWACRAGSSEHFWWGGPDQDFSAFGNLADARLHAVDTFAPWALPSGAIGPWRPAAEFDDGHRVSAPVGTYGANPWGLYDMHGNAAEWTGTRVGERAVVRGGSWYDPPRFAGSTAASAYPIYRGVFDVGFRIVITD
jgi:formylglycine-generating enzyme required for sulfatase activity